jgi:membrane protease YdiL (CAAX protease family)
MEKENQFSKRKFYNSDDSGKVFLFTVIFELLLSLAASFLPKEVTNGVWGIVISIVLSLLLYLSVYFIYTAYNGIEFNAVGIRKTKWQNYVLAIFIGAIALFGLQYLIGGVEHIFSLIGIPMNTSPIVGSTNFGRFLLVVVSSAIIPAVCEELIFRGMIFSGLRKSFSLPVAIVLSALLFALMHFSLQQFLYPFLLGMIMAWIVARTGSLVCSMIVHFANNFLVILMSYLNEVNGFSMALPFTWWYYLLAVGLAMVTGLIIFLIDKFYFKHKNQGGEVEKDEQPSKFVWIAIAVGVAMLVVITIASVLSAKSA